MARTFYGPTFEWDARRYVFDRRPTPVILLHRSRRLAAIAAAGALFAALAFFVAPPAGLTIEAWRALCIFGLAIGLWVFQPIPLAISSLTIFALAPLCGVLDATTAYAAFGNKVVFFILGAFILAGVVMASGLSTRLTLWTLNAIGNRPRRLLAGIYLLGAIFSTIMSEHAVAAMLFPIVSEIASSLGLVHGKSRYGRAMFLALSWGCIVGGTLTILGGARGPLAIGILESFSDGEVTIGFLDYVIFDFPMVMILLAIGWVLLRWAQGDDAPDLSPALRKLNGRLVDLGRFSWREAAVGLVMIVTVALWVFAGHRLGLANIAIGAIAALFVFRLTTWSEIETSVNWGIILMYGGAICLGAVLNESGASAWLAQHLLAGLGSPRALLIALAVGTVVMTEFMSNSAVIAIMMPMALTLSARMGIDPRIAAMSVALPSNLAFTLPMATPATAISFSSGYIRLKDSLRWGALLDLAGLGAFLFLLLVYWPMIGWGVE